MDEMEHNGIDEHTVATFIADDLWSCHSTFLDDDGHVHHCDPDSVEENEIRVNIDGESFVITVTKSSQ